MPDTVISCINELAYNELDQFIFTDCRGRPIGYIYITGVDRDTADSNKNKATQDPPHKLQAIE